MKLLTMKDVEERLGVTSRTVFNYIESGELKGFKLKTAWRFEESELDSFLKKQQEKRQTAEQRQPGLAALLEKEAPYWSNKKKWEETKLWVIELLDLNPQLRVRWEPEIGILIGPIQEPVTVTLTDDGIVVTPAEEKYIPELVAARH